MVALLVVTRTPLIAYGLTQFIFRVAAISDARVGFLPAGYRSSTTSYAFANP